VSHISQERSAEDNVPKVLIVDDHGLILEGLQIVIEREGMEVVGQATTGRQALAMTKECKPDVVLLDIRMPDMDGLEALAAIKSSTPSTTVIILTSYGNPEYFYRAIGLGAAGFLTKEGSPKQIAKAIRMVIEGESIVDGQLLKDSIKKRICITSGGISILPETLNPAIAPECGVDISKRWRGWRCMRWIWDGAIIST